MGFSRDYKMEMQVPLLELSIKKVFFGEFWKWRECSAVVVTQNISLWIPSLSFSASPSFCISPSLFIWSNLLFRRTKNTPPPILSETNNEITSGHISFDNTPKPSPNSYTKVAWMFFHKSIAYNVLNVNHIL